MKNVPFVRRLPPRDWLDNGLILDCFMDSVEARGLSLYEAQEEAVLALFENRNVILNTPTGSGKSLVASALHMKSLAWGLRSVYTCPIKALVNEKFMALCREFGAKNVGIVTGDSSVNADAPILCCTAEILSNMALRDGEACGVDDVVMDEFHYYSDKDRGVAWQVPLLTLSRTRFLLMSATLGDTDFFQQKLTALNGLETEVVKSMHRPVPLDFIYQETPLHETVAELVKSGKAPIYVVNFTQLDAAEEAQNFLSVDFCTKDEKKAIAAALENVQFDSPYGKDIQKLLRHGVGLHHAGLLPKYRLLVERLAQRGLLKIISGTDTLGVGVNVPIRTVLFTKLCKFDGEKVGILSVRDFRQISGRAGRKGFDDAGTVVVQAPEHVVENLRLENKAAGDPAKLRKLVKRKPPERGFVPWNKETFLKITSAPPEQLVSRFQVSHGMVLNVLSRERGGVEALRALIRDCHETDVTKKRLRAKAFELFRSLVDRGIIEILPREERRPGFTPLRVNVVLQDDFSLNQALSLFLVDTLKLLDPASPDYALRVLTLVESIQEDPDIILRKQLSRLKNEKMAELKMEGMEFDERVAVLEKMEHPKPDADFLYNTFNAFAAAYPWVGQEGVKPKSVAREMYEAGHSFDDYIREYDLQRSEGVLLRYLSYVYNALSQTVPDPAKTDELRELEYTFRGIIRETDSSLLDEWRVLHDAPPAGTPASLEGDAVVGQGEEPPLPVPPRDITRDRKEFTILVRNAVFRFLRLVAVRDFKGALARLEPRSLSLAEFEVAFKVFEEEHEDVVLDADARAHHRTSFVRLEGGTHLRVEQTLADVHRLDDWRLVFEVDYEASREREIPVLALVAFEPIG